MYNWLQRFIRWFSACVWKDELKALDTYEVTVANLQGNLRLCNRLRDNQRRDYDELKRTCDSLNAVIEDLRLRVVGGG